MGGRGGASRPVWRRERRCYPLRLRAKIVYCFDAEPGHSPASRFTAYCHGLLRARGWQTIVVHVVDEAELVPAAMVSDGFGGKSSLSAPLSELVEVETGQRLRLTPSDVIFARYRAAVAGWLAEIERACEDEQVDYLRLLTGWPFDTVVLRLLYEQRVVA